MGASQYYVLTRGAVLRNVVQTRPRHRLAHWSGFSSMMLVLGLLMHFCGPTAPTSIYVFCLSHHVPRITHVSTYCWMRTCGGREPVSARGPPNIVPDSVGLPEVYVAL